MKLQKYNNIINEKDFAGVLSELKSLRPETHFDEDFSSGLKSRLLGSLAGKRSIISPYKTVFSSRIFYSMLGSVLTVLIAVPLTFVATKKEAFPDQPLIFNLFQVKDSTSGLALKQQINSKGINAFGTLAPIVSTSTPDQDLQAGLVYEYKGAAVDLKEADVTVFKRTKDAGLKAVYQNSDESNKIAPILASTTPSDSSIISISDDFLKSHSIDISIFDKPVVVKAASSTKEGFLDSVSVLYPLLIDGKKVYTESGSLYGISATIDVLQNRVSTIDNLTSQIYDSSAYKPETDFSKILNAATSTLSAQIADKVYGTITLGTSTRVLLQHFSNEKSGAKDELYIPAMIFPVQYESEVDGLPSVVVVPVVKDFLVKQSENNTPNQ